VVTRFPASAEDLEVRISRDPADIAAAQALRYQVFYQEMAAEPTAAMAAASRDFDDFDAICDHLLVIDRGRSGDQVVGTYRLLRQEVAESSHGFYSAGEYDLSRLYESVSRPGALLEVGRSCVHRDYRTTQTIQRLWQSIAGYIAEHGIEYLFGCASLPGTDPSALTVPLAYLHERYLAPPRMRVRALPERYVAMDAPPAEPPRPVEVIRSLPPLIKGYLRLGAFVGDGAVVDHQFGTTDVFIVLPRDRVAARYATHFARAEAASGA
jgi:putative hemolysin